MPQLSPLRLNLLRGPYLLMAIGLGVTLWPGIINHAHDWELMRGVVVCMLAAMSLLALLGLRYPLQMLPLLFFEMGWKALWLGLVAWPQWSGHRMDAATAETAFECLVVLVFLPLIPWDYVIAAYVRGAGDPWLGRARTAPDALPVS